MGHSLWLFLVPVVAVGLSGCGPRVCVYFDEQQPALACPPGGVSAAAQAGARVADALLAAGEGEWRLPAVDRELAIPAPVSGVTPPAVQPFETRLPEKKGPRKRRFTLKPAGGFVVPGPSDLVATELSGGSVGYSDIWMPSDAISLSLEMGTGKIRFCFNTLHFQFQGKGHDTWQASETEMMNFSLGLKLGKKFYVKGAAGALMRPTIFRVDVSSGGRTPLLEGNADASYSFGGGFEFRLLGILGYVEALWVETSEEPATSEYFDARWPDAWADPFTATMFSAGLRLNF